MDFTVLPLHKHPEYLQKCCDLINSEWKRSVTARMRSLESSSDLLPVSLILLKADQLVGHLKLSPIPSIKTACFVESVVIDKNHRGNGLGTILMNRAEKYCRDQLHLSTIYLSTKGQEGFYSKLSYYECKPISIYGGFSACKLGNNSVCIRSNSTSTGNVPKPPPMPSANFVALSTTKTYMKKEL